MEGVSGVKHFWMSGGVVFYMWYKRKGTTEFWRPWDDIEAAWQEKGFEGTPWKMSVHACTNKISGTDAYISRSNNDFTCFLHESFKKKKSDFNLCRSKSGFKLSKLKKKTFLKIHFTLLLLLDEWVSKVYFFVHVNTLSCKNKILYSANETKTVCMDRYYYV